MDKQKPIKAKSLSDKEKELVLMRLDALPSDVIFYSGGGEKISRDEMINHVEKNDTIGKEHVAIEMEFLRAIKNGELMKRITQFDTSQYSPA